MTSKWKIRFTARFMAKIETAQGLNVEQAVETRLTYYFKEVAFLRNGVGMDVFAAPDGHGHLWVGMYVCRRQKSEIVVWGFTLLKQDPGDMKMMAKALGIQGGNREEEN